MGTPHILSRLVSSQKRIFQADLPTTSLKRLSALRLLESRIGYEAALSICEETPGQKIDYLTIPDSGDAMLALRERINREIGESEK